MPESIRVAVVGLAFGNSFIPGFLAHPDVLEVGICDTNADLMRQVALEHQIPESHHHANLDDVIASRKYDAVALFTPIPDHAAHCIKAMEAGLHCACAVPMATTLDDIRRLTQVRQKTGLTYMMMETSLYTPEFLMVQQMHQSGEFGEIQFMRGVWHNNLENHPRYWHGLPPMHYITHPLAPMLKLAGRRVDKIACFGSGDMRAPLKQVYGNPYPIQSAIFQLGPQPISPKTTPIARADRPLALEVTSITIETALQYKETFDLWGTRQSFNWASICEDKHALIRIWPARETGPKASPQTVFRFDAPSAHDRLPRPLQPIQPRRPQPHLVHEFVRAVIEARPSAIDVDEAAAFTEPGIRAHAIAMEQ